MNLTAGAIRPYRALEIAREVFNSDDDDTLMKILWFKTCYAMETSELKLIEGLEAWKAVIEKVKKKL